MKLTNDYIAELKSRNRIENVISQYVTLKRSGSTYVGLCPFHSEKTPSFHVFEQSQSYYCFGCENGGDVITFIMQTQNLPYLEAINYLGKRVGMPPIDNAQDVDTASSSELRQRVYAVNKESAKYFHKLLMDEKSKDARNYIMNERKLSKPTLIHFGIGYAPKFEGDYIKYMQSCGYSTDDLITAKMCYQTNDKVHAFFRDRIIFPIIDNSGNIIGFGGRTISDDPRKYLNSSDTPVFKKNKNLYSLNFAKNTGKEQMILCEGYMDVIGFNLAGFTNAIATLGTALTQEQAGIISRYTKKVILSYDSDEAGRRATTRAIPMLTNAGLEVVVLTLKGAKDPFEYVTKFGKDKLVEAVNNSEGKIDFTIGEIMKKYNLSNSDEKSQAAKELCQLAASQISSIDRELYINEIVKRLDLNKVTISEEVGKLVRISESKAKEKEQLQAISKVQGFDDTVNPEYAKNIKEARAEETILSLLMLYPEFLNSVREGKIDLKADDFVTSFNKKVFIKLLEDGFVAFNSLSDTEQEVSRLARIMNLRIGKSDNSENMLISNIDILKRKHQSSSIEDIIKRKRKSSDENNA